MFPLMCDTEPNQATQTTKLKGDDGVAVAWYTRKNNENYVIYDVVQQVIL